MALEWPRTVKGWATVISCVLVILSTLGGAAWQWHSANAYASDVIEVKTEVIDKIEEVEQYAAQGIKNATCNQLRATIRQLQREKNNDPDTWTGSDESYLQDLLLQWQQYCVNGEG